MTPPPAAPPIPTRCVGRPTTPDGLVVPFGNVRLADGGCDFRSHHNTAWRRCWHDGICQVCGQPLDRPIVLLCGPRQLAQLLFDEPPLHPECARYVTVACPMVAGHRTRYALGPTLADRSRGHRCPDGCPCGGWVPTPGLRVGAGGGDAHEWYAVYVRDYALAVPAGSPDITGGICAPDQVVRVRLVSRPGAGPVTPWEAVPDWAARYQPPDIATSTEESRCR